MHMIVCLAWLFTFNFYIPPCVQFCLPILVPSSLPLPIKIEPIPSVEMSKKSTKRLLHYHRVDPSLYHDWSLLPRTFLLIVKWIEK